MLIQELWKLKLGWDEQILEVIKNKWELYTDSLKTINDTIIPRHVIADNVKEAELHGFADESHIAYGACVYIKTTDSDGKQYVKLLT